MCWLRTRSLVSCQRHVGLFMCLLCTEKGAGVPRYLSESVEIDKPAPSSTKYLCFFCFLPLLVFHAHHLNSFSLGILVIVLRCIIAVVAGGGDGCLGSERKAPRTGDRQAQFDRHRDPVRRLNGGPGQRGVISCYRMLFREVTLHRAFPIKSDCLAFYSRLVAIFLKAAPGPSRI